MNREPYMNMSEPNKKDYQVRTRNIALFYYYEHFAHDDYDRDMDEEEEENHRSNFPSNDGPMDGVSHWYSGYRDQPKLPKSNMNHLNLQQILDLLPAGVAPADVKMSVSIDTGDMGIYGHEVVFYYKKKCPAEPEQFKKDHDIWKKLCAEYEIRNSAYKKLEADKEIAELEAKISKLKK
jgi:hypothetical protein